MAILIGESSGSIRDLRVEGAVEGGVGGDEWVARKQVVSMLNQIE
jgi:hypothetical protein